MNDDKKRELGQYYTVENPFELEPFLKWFKSIPNIKNEVLLEPFAGANNIINMVDSGNTWSCYDVNPPEYNAAPQFPVIERDTIANFPTGYHVCITNPPYLAKNSASRRHIPYCGEPYDDLYKKCIEVMLNNCDYVAAIIPESFITAGVFEERLTCVISLTCKMFDDTDCPVCLALFDNKIHTSYEIYAQNKLLGTNIELSKYIPEKDNTIKWVFNDKEGNIGAVCIDSQKGETVRFIHGEEINPDDIKVSSRAFTRVSCSIDIEDLDKFLDKCNKILKKYRNNTKDVFMTSFKGLRADGKYRRRMDFDLMKRIMSEAIKYGNS